MRYAVFFRRVLEGRAREHIDLREYDNAGSVDANSLREAERAVRARDDSRELTVGDVLIDRLGDAHTYTPYGAWAKTKIIKRDT